jgi:phosphomannomutase
MSDIKFGTDGWRAIIAKDFTVDNVARVTDASARWLLKNFNSPKVVVGHDCRFAGELFAETVAKVLHYHGIKVLLARDFVSTPMISLAAKELNCDLGIIITASHNPPSYNGFKLKGGYGGPLIPSKVAEIEAMIERDNKIDTDNISLDELVNNGSVELVNIEEMYIDHVRENFDLDAIRSSGIRLAYDAMYGAGQNVMKKLLPDTTFLHADYNPSFMGQAPEPIHKNLIEFSELIKRSGNIDCGLATDGDADRLGFYDSEGRFVDSHHIMLLIVHYLHTHKKMNGKVCVAFSATPKVAKLAKHFNLPMETVKIGFKYICEIMLKEDVLMGGEESGGIAIKGHIPERDGIWIGLVLLEYMAKTGKNLNQLIDEVYEIVGSFAFERSDLHIDEALKQKVLQNCRDNKYHSFGRYKVARIEDIDGYKYFFDNDDWLMIRASGTEPVLRTYAESSTQEKAFDILQAGEKTLLG